MVSLKKLTRTYIGLEDVDDRVYVIQSMDMVKGKYGDQLVATLYDLRDRINRKLGLSQYAIKKLVDAGFADDSELIGRRVQLAIDKNSKGKDTIIMVVLPVPGGSEANQGDPNVQ